MKHPCCDGRMETHNIIIITQARPNRLRGMEIFNVLGNEISPGDTLPRPSHNETVWSLSHSPGTGPSPVSELSFSLKSLRCHDGADTPRRKLRLTPELVTPSPPGPTPGSTCGRGLAPKGEETPTGNVLTDSGNRRRGERFLSPACSAPKMKRLRVKLSTRFCSVAVQRSDPGVRGLRCQGQSSPPGGGALHVRQGDMELPDVEALLSVRRVRSRRWHFPPSSLLGSTMEDHTLTGDYSKTLLLPVERVEHQDLHCISAQTVASLLRGQYSGTVGDFLIIDCRYPYEYHGGHIRGADNLHTEAQIQGALLQLPALYQLSSWGRAPTSPPGQAPDPGVSGTSMGGVLQRSSSQSHSPGSCTTPPGQGSPMEGSSPRKLIVFHCEFSSERGPRLCHYLRELDRALHASLYPLLFYPELYLLEGGYRHFYSCYPELCEPRGYVPMLHREYREQLGRFRRKTKARLHKRLPLYKTH
ncbi:cell division cycle 25 homolog d isoform X1 [Salvelinus fontinalis]|uniref:cell division cycle 25 homolog d isoform X1 n=2 Tax=Salvelinus fontinalis TaxID=8038 RepID=UPI0024854F11|nr:cell division cycle 25 homolog d isoform X1 [Salvelinus fontinalis]